MRLTTLLLTALSTSAFAQEGKTDPWRFNGYVDMFYQYDFGRSANGVSVNGRSFDLENNRLTIAFAELDAVRSAGNGFPLGLTFQIYAGRGPDIIHLAEPGGQNSTKWLRQAFATYTTQGSHPVTIDFGKFDTWIGYEAPDNRIQDQYSRSFNSTYSEPVYETGLRVATKLSEKLTGTFYLVQGWSEVEDANKSKSFGINLTYTPDSTTSVTLQSQSGIEGSTTANDAGLFGGIGFGVAGTSRVNLTNLIVSKQLSEKTKLAFSVDYGTAAGSPNSGAWSGAALYLKYRLSPKQATAFRLERFEDSGGLRTGSAGTKLGSLTGTYDHVVNDHLTLRLELRSDFADRAFFNDRNGLTKNRVTLTVGAVARF